MAITKNFKEVERFCKEMKEKTIDVIKKSVGIEELLDQPEVTYMMGECLKIYDESANLLKEQARQLDEMAEYLENSYKIIQRMEENINELRKEVKELGAH